MKHVTPDCVRPTQSSVIWIVRFFVPSYTFYRHQWCFSAWYRRYVLCH